MSEESTECYICDRNGRLESLPVRERILTQGGWRVAHAFDTSLPGWLVLAPLRHVSALAELTLDEARVMGELLRCSSSALQRVVGCERTYVMLFAEAVGFSHLHLHVVPRMDGFTADQVGPQVFAFLGRPPDERLGAAEQDLASLEIRDAMTTLGS